MIQNRMYEKLASPGNPRTPWNPLRILRTPEKIIYMTNNWKTPQNPLVLLGTSETKCVA